MSTHQSSAHSEHKHEQKHEQKHEHEVPLLPTHSNGREQSGFNMVSFLSIGALILAIAIPLTIAFFLSSVGGGGDSDWYKQLKKPGWTPPAWVFPVVWTTLYVLIGIASWLVWKEGGFRAQAFPLGLYLLQLLFNFAWTPLFFGLHRPDVAFGEIILLGIAVIVNFVVFFRVNQVAGYLFIPYILWVIIAATLNGYIWLNNPQLQSGYSIAAPLNRGPGVGSPGIGSTDNYS